jgi:serine/threonine protein kinase/predicted ATPase/Tfp pilus assembly protein PilF
MLVGDLVAERYRLEASVASGGMGTVYRALDLRSSRFVAVKTCLAAAADDSRGGPPAPQARARARFELEARALAEISHDFIVSYVDHGISDLGEPFLVMDWVEGETLAERLAGGGLSVEQSLLLARDLSQALRAIHDRGIVHRDLKPANVMLRGGDVRWPVLVDFGVARRAENVSVTLSGARVGTLLYMAPEQIRDPRRVDGRADVFALGCLLFECLTGSRAFDSDDALSTIARILLDDAPDPRQARADLPADAALLVGSMLARAPQARPAPDDALERRLEALAEAARQLQLDAPPRLSSTVGSSGAPLARLSAGAPTAAESLLESPRALRAQSESRRRVLPARADTFVGREEELSHLTGLVQSGASLVVVWGPAGMGKTRLAQELAQRDGPGKLQVVELVELAHARDLDDALRIFVRGFAASLRGSESAEQVIGRALARLGECVFIVDRVEHLARELTPMLELWRRSAPGVCFLLTSRERLRVEGALALELGPLRVARAERLLAESESLSPAGQLLFERVREGDATFELDFGRRRAVEAAALALEGIPLAIELAAARVSLLGLDGVVARLANQRKLLGGSEPSSAEGEATMRAAIGASVELLSAVERLAFAQCSVFRGGFTVAAAEAVLQLGAGAPPVLDVLQSLRDKSLLSSLVSGAPAGEARLALFSVVRQRAAIELAGSGEEASVRARHGAYFSSLAREHSRAARAGERRAAARIERDSDDLVAAVDYALAGPQQDVRLALDTLIALEPVISARGPLPAFMQLVDRAIAAAEAAAESTEARSLNRLVLLRARLAATSGRFDFALAELERVIEHAQTGAVVTLEASAELERGVVYHLRRSLGEARACYERARALLRQSEDPELEGRSVGNLGALLHDEGRFPEAAAYYFRAVHLLEETGELRMRGNFLNNLGVLEQEMGEPGRARKHYEQALGLLAQAADDRLLAITLGNLGVLEQECSDWQRARRCHEQALELFAPLADASSEALCLARLGATQATLGDTTRADEHLRRAQLLARSAETSRREAVRLQRAFLELALARESLAARDVEAARARLDQAAERCAHVERSEGGEPGLAARSDDIRITLRILRPMLAELSRRLAEYPGA